MQVLILIIITVAILAVVFYVQYKSVRRTLCITNRIESELKKTIKPLLKQSHVHQFNLERILKCVVDVMRKEFYEDNDPTLKAFIKEALEKAFIDDKTLSE